MTVPDGRKWNCETDASVSGGSETVSPILKLADIPMLQEVVRALRKAGAKTGGISPTAQPCRVAVGYKGCAGLHIHVGAQGMSPKQIQNLVKIFYKQEELIVKALGVTESRLGRSLGQLRYLPVDAALFKRIVFTLKMCDSIEDEELPCGKRQYVQKMVA